jgi:hypothetical protein
MEDNHRKNERKKKRNKKVNSAFTSHTSLKSHLPKHATFRPIDTAPTLSFPCIFKQVSKDLSIGLIRAAMVK